MNATFLNYLRNNNKPYVKAGGASVSNSSHSQFPQLRPSITSKETQTERGEVLTKSLRSIHALLKASENSNASRYEIEFERAVAPLTDDVIRSADTFQLLELLSAARRFRIHSSTVVHSVCVALAARRKALKGASLLKCLLVLCRPHSLSIAPQRVNYFVVLLSEELTLEGRLHHAPRRLLLSVLRLSTVRGNLLQTDLSIEVLKEVLTRSKGCCLPREIADVSKAIAQFGHYTKEAAEFFVASASIIEEELETLSGKELSYIIHAFAHVGFPGQELFKKLGQRAGDIGEDLHVSDVGRVLAGLDRAGIASGPLRASLESSMRLRHAFSR